MRLLEVEEKYNELQTANMASDTISCARILEPGPSEAQRREIADQKQELEGMQVALSAWDEAVQQRDEMIRSLHAEKQKYEKITEDKEKGVESAPSFMAVSQSGPDNNDPFARPGASSSPEVLEDAVTLKKTIEDMGTN